MVIDMKLSIIVPVYNMASGGKLEYCLDSLLKQTIEDYEIIAVDDASTDTSLDILRAYEAGHPDRIRVIASPENRRQGGAKNLGLKASSGTWIGFIDSDDWIAPDMYEKLLDKAERTGADMVGCDYQITYGHSMDAGRVVVNNTQEQTGVLTPEKYKSLILMSGSMVVKIYLNKIIKKYRLDFPEKIFYEDNCAAPVWYMHFRHFEKVDEPLYYYYQHEVSTVHHISEAKCRDRLSAGQLLLESFKRDGYYEPYYKELEYRFTELYYVNTLFTYAYGVKFPRLRFLAQMREGLLAEFPDFQENEYYKARTHPENKRMIGYQLKSSLFFILYYKALNLYRRLRYRKGV